VVRLILQEGWVLFRDKFHGIMRVGFALSGGEADQG
jgi:hypothetical protein